MTQKEALDILKMGHNVFLTGPAGSGKTFVLNQYIDYLREYGVNVGITASTGIAATHMGGTTIHSWSGLGIRSGLPEHDLSILETKKHLLKNIEKAKVLIIDEVSMLDHFRLDLIDRIIRRFKKNKNLPFGGMQIVLCGDFFQLPPISDSYDEPARLAYHSESWNNSDFKVCYLEEQYRQKDDGFLKVLNDIRGNRVNEDTLACLENRRLEMTGIGTNNSWQNNSEGVVSERTRLYTHNVDVDTLNHKELRKLLGKEYVFNMTASGAKNLVENLKKGCLAPDKLLLKIGARVMFVKNNFEKGYVNGTLGIISGFDTTTGDPIVETNTGDTVTAEKTFWRIDDEGSIKAEIRQYPLRLAWAITVHKSQGMSLDAVDVDLSRTFEKGMGYVALSRVRSLEGLRLLGINRMALEVNPEVLEIDEELRNKSDDNADNLNFLGKEKVEEIQKDFLYKATEGRMQKVDKKDLQNFSVLKRSKKLKVPKEEKVDTLDVTKSLVEKQMSLSDIARERGLKEETIIDHIEKIIGVRMKDDGTKVSESDLDIEYLRSEVPRNRFHEIERIFDEQMEENKDMHLAPIKNKLGANVSYRDIRLVRLFLKK